MNAHQTWHIAFADIALILFLLTATALAREEDISRREGIVEASASAIYNGRTSQLPFNEWLDARQIDPRENLTIIVRYTRLDADQAYRAGALLARQAKDRNLISRIVIEPGQYDEALAVLAFDGTPEMARSLLQPQEAPTNGDL